MVEMAESISKISIFAFASALVFATFAVFLWFKFKISEVIDYLCGINIRKIEEKRKNSWYFGVKRQSSGEKKEEIETDSLPSLTLEVNEKTENYTEMIRHRKV